jgi:hypothetical protein
MTDQTWETDKVVLWIGNNEGFYRTVLECDNYAQFVEIMQNSGIFKTPYDNVAWDDDRINTDYLDEYIQELKRD